MLDICAERTTAAGVKQVLVIWRPTWEPVEQVNSGAVWENWVSEQKTFAAREKRVGDGAESADDAGAEDSSIKRRRGRPPKNAPTDAPTAVLVEAARAAVESKNGSDVADNVGADVDQSSSDDDSKSDGDGSNSDVAEDLKKAEIPKTTTTTVVEVVGTGRGKEVTKRGRGRPRGRGGKGSKK